MELTATQLDALKEIGNIGSGNAATSLSKILRKRIEVHVPYIGLVEIEKVPELMGGQESHVTSVLVPVKGAFGACLMLILNQSESLRLAELVLGRKKGNLKKLDESAQSALKELGNISSASYLWALSKILKQDLIGSVPELASDMLQAILDEILSGFALKVTKVVVLETEFEVENETVKGYFVFLPAPEGLKQVLEVLKV